MRVRIQKLGSSSFTMRWVLVDADSGQIAYRVPGTTVQGATKRQAVAYATERGWEIVK